MKIFKLISVALSVALIFLAQPAAAQSIADARFGLAMSTYKQEGSAQRARQLLLEALEIDPAHKAATFNLALLYEVSEDWAQAINGYEKYIELDATDPYAEAARAKIRVIKSYIEADKTPEGKKDRIYRQHVDRARNHLSGGRPGAAIALAELAVETDPNRYEGYAAFGAALLDAERFSLAADQLRLALERAPQAERIQISSMLSLAEKYASYQGELTVADEHYAAGRYRQAGETYGRIWAILDEPTFAFQAADAWAQAGVRDRAASIYEALANSNDRQTYERAQKEAQRLDETPLPNTLDGQRNAALAAVNSPEYASAVKQIEEDGFYRADIELSLLIEPFMPDSAASPLFLQRAIARIGNRDFLSALRDLTMVLLLDPENTMALGRRVTVYQELKRPLDAARDLERLIELTADQIERDRLVGVRAALLSRANESTRR